MDAHRLRAEALGEATRAMWAGLPAEGVYVSDHVVVITRTEVAAARWRARFGDELAGLPLQVLAVMPLAVSA